VKVAEAFRGIGLSFPDTERDALVAKAKPEHIRDNRKESTMITLNFRVIKYMLGPFLIFEEGTSSVSPSLGINNFILC
jgi:hypothetical protein